MHSYMDQCLKSALKPVCGFVCCRVLTAECWGIHIPYVRAGLSPVRSESGCVILYCTCGHLNKMWAPQLATAWEQVPRAGWHWCGKHSHLAAYTAVLEPINNAVNCIVGT